MMPHKCTDNLDQLVRGKEERRNIWVCQECDNQIGIETMIEGLRRNMERLMLLVLSIKEGQS